MKYIYQVYKNNSPTGLKYSTFEKAQATLKWLKETSDPRVMYGIRRRKET